MPKNFAMTGVAGYVAARHLKAIHDTGNYLVACVDPHDSIGILDQYSFDVRFFTEIERFDRHLEKLRRGPEERKVHFISICSPNYLHDAHCRLAMRVGADVICEKPLVINPWNLDALQELESELGRRINTVLQLRLHPKLVDLRRCLLEEHGSFQHDVCLTYVTARGSWYLSSWKGSIEKSGGISTNIGIHFFDLLIWLFGKVSECRVYHADARRMSGYLEFERARVRWFLSVAPEDMPFETKSGLTSTFRSITIDGQEVDFSSGFTDLFTHVYQEVLAGRGLGIVEARPSIELAYRIRTAPVSRIDSVCHPFLQKR